MDEIYITIEMYRGLINKVRAFKTDPHVDEVPDEDIFHIGDWDEGVKVYIVELED